MDSVAETDTRHRRGSQERVLARRLENKMESCLPKSENVRIYMG